MILMLEKNGEQQYKDILDNVITNTLHKWQSIVNQIFFFFKKH